MPVRDCEIDGSFFKIISIATVTQDKNTNSRFISCFLHESLPFYEGPITSDFVDIQRRGTDANGQAYDITLQRSMSVKAEWLGNAGNKVTSPAVRKGDVVKIWSAGDGIYYWEEMGRSGNKLKRTENPINTFNAAGMVVP